MQRHYLHLSQETLGMMGISLFGTCTMKYNPRVNEQLDDARRASPSSTRDQDDSTMQGLLEIVHELRPDAARAVGHGPLRLPARRRRGRGVHARLRDPRLPRRRAASSAQRDEIITTIQAHPCNPATAAAAGFNVITLPLEENGYPSLDALRAACSPTAPPR